MRAPDFVGAGEGARQWRAWAGKLEPVGKRENPDHNGCLAHWLVYAPGAHAAISHWLVMVLHLRPLEGESRPAVKHFPEAAYEIGCVAATSPSDAVGQEEIPPGPEALDIDRPESIQPLTPQEWAVQFAQGDDAMAVRIGVGVIKRIMSGEVSPDADFRRYWATTIPATAKCFAEHNHDPN